jgi:cellulose binding protein with CBM2 domain
LSAKHAATSEPGPARYSPARLFLVIAAVILVALVVWIAVRAAGPGSAAGRPAAAGLPFLSAPLSSFPPTSPSSSTAPGLRPPPGPSSSAPVPPGADRSLTAEPAPARSAPARSTAGPAAPGRSAPEQSAPTRSAPARTPPTASPRSGNPAFAATLTLSGSWDTGYIATLRVENTGTAAGAITVTVTHHNQPGLRLGPVWNATGEQHGDTFTFHADSVAPGASTTFGYQGNKDTGANARPAGCTIVGGSCRVS